MTRFLFIPAIVVSLAGCAVLEQAAAPPTGETVAETPTNAPPPPPANARTVEDFDTTSAEDRAAAATVSADGRLLGSVVASLGDPTRPGFWIETPLVSEAGRGRVALSGGKSVEVDLIPGAAGSRLSLAALRLLEVPLTDLPTVQVYAF
ncbi:hypothetical protein GQ651_08050 [Alphaproteobacteria bacterium GH1-50]|uniref:D-galactarate dehydratase n=1 Tax=Kangsaoukella pontilimi TaxID=2691042 RepID=A0A7C9MQX6_9RHOB|nr:hypothetical protein [Kangsaoukella pontilimi]MXQ07797.1 hypothetical protein [Kangsaoukella pontilimi]